MKAVTDGVPPTPSGGSLVGCGGLCRCRSGLPFALSSGCRAPTSAGTCPCLLRVREQGQACRQEAARCELMLRHSFWGTKSIVLGIFEVTGGSVTLGSHSKPPPTVTKIVLLYSLVFRTVAHSQRFLGGLCMCVVMSAAWGISCAEVYICWLICLKKLILSFQWVIIFLPSYNSWGERDGYEV